MAKGYISSCICVSIGILISVFGSSGVAGMTRTYVSRSWYLIFFKDQTLMTFVRVRASANEHVFLIYCYMVMAFHASGLFRVAVMTKIFVSRCWDLIYSRTIFWWALCVSESAHSFFAWKLWTSFISPFPSLCSQFLIAALSIWIDIWPLPSLDCWDREFALLEFVVSITLSFLAWIFAPPSY